MSAISTETKNTPQTASIMESVRVMKERGRDVPVASRGQGDKAVGS